MRAWPIVLLLLMPGCLTQTPAVVRLGLFELEPATREDPVPQAFPHCEALLETLNHRALVQARVNLEQSIESMLRYPHYGGPVTVGVADLAAQDSVVGAPRAAAASQAQVTGTNNQEAEADEGDVLKTDGEWTYVLLDQKLRILRSLNVGDAEEYASLAITETYGGQLLLERRDPSDPSDDRLVVVTTMYRTGAPWDDFRPTARLALGHGFYSETVTRVMVLSLADRRAPELLEEFQIEGSPAGARLVDGIAHVVVNRFERSLGLQSYLTLDDEALARHGLNRTTFEAMPEPARKSVLTALAFETDARNRQTLANLSLADHLPVIVRDDGAVSQTTGLGAEDCRRVWTVSESTGRSVSTILSLDLGPEEPASRTTQVLGGQPIVYASGRALVLASPSQDTWWFWLQPTIAEATDLLWFDLDGLEVRPRASGRVAGLVLNSFSLDVSGDELRVATTTGTWGRWWIANEAQREPMMSHVATFTASNGRLAPHGMVGGIAPGERIWSARFTDERAYLVTFRQVDPLWIIDLTTTPPRILGELEIPGVSTYIHPLDDNTLLTIGYAGAEGGGLEWGRPQVSLFDISDPRSPRRADVLDLAPEGSGHSWSGATREHKAFTYWSAIGVLAVPVSSYRHGQTGDAWWSESHVGLRLIDVDAAGRRLSVRGEVDQDHLLAAERSWGAEIVRSYFLGFPETGPVSVYSLSALGLTAHDLYTLERQAAVAFSAPGH